MVLLFMGLAAFGIIWKTKMTPARKKVTKKAKPAAPKELIADHSELLAESAKLSKELKEQKESLIKHDAELEKKHLEKMDSIETSGKLGQEELDALKLKGEQDLEAYNSRIKSATEKIAMIDVKYQTELAAQTQLSSTRSDECKQMTSELTTVTELFHKKALELSTLVASIEKTNAEVDSMRTKKEDFEKKTKKAQADWVIFSRDKKASNTKERKILEEKLKKQQDEIDGYMEQLGSQQGEAIASEELAGQK